ncbi:uncharacterized protein LOC143209033 [Lasioglossum baleicum]|uniref:uncharacterized protein LOC143209033 n=1 Tax=Lasioglossum baleicum TaxID=434251 RepID=UPI003FCC8881
MSDNMRNSKIRELTRLRVQRLRKRRKLCTEFINSEADTIVMSKNSESRIKNLVSHVVEISGVNRNIPHTINDDIVSSEGDETSEDTGHNSCGNHTEPVINYQNSSNETTDEEGAENCQESGFNDIRDIRQWALMDPPIPHTRLEILMDILRKHSYPTLPKTAKTFLATACNNYTIESFNGTNDEFVYFGISKVLEKCVNPEIHKSSEIPLMFNVDGLPLFKSSKKQFWPILCKIFHDPDIYRPFPVAIYCGDGKPTNIERYLEKFINEINDLQRNGIAIDSRRFTISIKAFICDRPARSFLKCNKGHGGYFACERFRNQSNTGHHLGISPLLRINPKIDMINHFLLDSMHLLYLGIMKKLLHYWIDGNVKGLKLSDRAKVQLSDLLQRIKVPAEFQRTTRSLTEYHKFKATEYRFLLLYAAPVIFKKILTTDMMLKI